VLKALSAVVEGTPPVKTFDLVNATFYTAAAKAPQCGPESYDFERADSRPLAAHYDRGNVS